MTHPPLTHVDEHGQARMVDVAAKPATHRTALARGEIHMLPATMQAILANQVKKGDVLAVARIAGIMAAKRASDLVPLCHPLALTQVELQLQPDPLANRVVVQALVANVGQTGVEIEALLAVQIALLTIYDMCKALDRGMVLTEVRLLEKHGGKSGSFVAGG